MNAANPVDGVLARLKGVKRSGSGWTGRCPAHEDGDPSLSIGTGADGRVLLNCHRGCSPESIVAAMGLELRDLFPESDRRPGPNGADLVCAYDYRDANGRLLFQVVRYFPKTFRQRRPDGIGGWAWSVADIERVLYRLPDVTRAVADGATVYVTEGEKDADRLASVGLAATCNAGGAGKWEPQFTAALAGASVAILPDNDEPGREHAAAVAARLAAAGCEVRVVELPGLPAKGDVSDWLDAGGAVDELRQLVQKAPVWQDPDALPRAVPIGELPPEPPVKWLARGALPRDIVLISSDGGVGKTTVALAIAGHSATGTALHDWPAFAADNSGPVLFVSEEDSGAMLRNRLEALARGHGWNVQQVVSRVHVIALAGASLDSEEWREHIRSEVARIGAVAVIFDPYTELTSAKENSNDEAKPVIKFWRRLCSEFGVAVIVLHHSGKAGQDKRKQDRALRGASALFGAARAVYYLEENELGVAVECLKFNRAAKPAPFVLAREVESDPDNPGTWLTASLRYVTSRQAEDDAATAFVRRNLEEHGQLNTTQVKELAKGSGISALDISAAISRMETLREIAFERGEHNSKNWYLTVVAEKSGQPRQPLVASLPSGCPASAKGPSVVAPTVREGNQADERASRQASRQASSQTHPTDELGKGEAAA